MRPRDLLLIPVAAAVTLLWLAAGFSTLIFPDPLRAGIFYGTIPLELAVVGYVTGVVISRKATEADE